MAILILLQLRQRLTADALAEEFEVSVRTIYRDIDSLSAAGIPVYGDRGPGGGFQLVDGYRTKLTGLAPDEAEAMVMIGLPSAAADLGLAVQADTARNKLFASLPAAKGQSADRLAHRFHLDASSWYQAAQPLPHLPAITRAVLDQSRLSMTYQSWTKVKSWSVEPFGLVLKAGIWYLAAQSHGKMHIFRLSSITQLSVLPERFERDEKFNLARWWQAEQMRFEASLFNEVATVRASPEGCKRLAAQSPRGAEAVARSQTEAAGDWRRMQMRVENSDHGAREILALGPEIEVLAPADFRARVALYAAAIAQLHRGEDA